jgi:hypothetical protein
MRTLFGLEAGNLMDPKKVSYAKTFNWQQGFNIVALGQETFGVEQVMINSGLANISTLGRTIRG